MLQNLCSHTLPRVRRGGVAAFLWFRPGSLNHRLLCMHLLPQVRGVAPE